jgi:hypothetical protein
MKNYSIFHFNQEGAEEKYCLDAHRFIAPYSSRIRSHAIHQDNCFEIHPFLLRAQLILTLLLHLSFLRY